MKRFLLLLLLLVAACSESDDDGPNQDACSVLGLDTRVQGVVGKIINGTLCEMQGAPVVEITSLFSNGSFGLCSGTMITSTKAITAAHCFRPPSANTTLTRFSVMVQGVDTESSGYVSHPQANGAQNDVAIVTLVQAATVPHIPILASRPIITGDIISVFGYGLDENGNFGALRSGQMKVTGTTGQDIYAEFTTEDGSNVCFGDSGGPALFSFEGQPTIVGVTSYATQQTCTASGISAFANVQAVSILDFILEQVPDAQVL